MTNQVTGAGLACPQCGGTVTVTTNTVWSAPVLMFKPDLGQAVEARRGQVRTWAGCDSCEWCGPVADTKGAA